MTTVFNHAKWRQVVVEEVIADLKDVTILGAFLTGKHTDMDLELVLFVHMVRINPSGTALRTILGWLVVGHNTVPIVVVHVVADVDFTNYVIGLRHDESPQGRHVQ